MQPAASALIIGSFPCKPHWFLSLQTSDSGLDFDLMHVVCICEHGCCAVQRRKEMKQQLGLPEDYGIDNSDSEQGELPLGSVKHSNSRAVNMQLQSCKSAAGSTPQSRSDALQAVLIFQAPAGKWLIIVEKLCIPCCYLYAA